MSHSVVLINSMRGTATGFLINHFLIVTNNHVIDSFETAENATFQFGLNTDVFTQMHLTIQQPLMPPAAISTFNMDFDPQCFFWTSPEEELDVTVVAIGPVPDQIKAFHAALSPFPLYGMPRHLDLPAEQNDSRNWIVQHRGHERVVGAGQFLPFDTGLVSDRRGASVRFGSQKIAEYQDQADPADFQESFIWYNTDTDPGASGSPICDSRWRLKGIHNTSVWAKDPADKRCHLNADGERSEDSKSAWFIANRGIKIESVREALEDHLLSMIKPTADGKQTTQGFALLRGALEFNNRDFADTVRLKLESLRKNKRAAR